LKRTHDGGEEGESRKYNEFHGWGVRGVSPGGELGGGNGAAESVYVKLE